MAGNTTATTSTTASGDDADTLAAKRRGDEIYVNGVTAAKEGIAGITNWFKGIFGAGDLSSTSPANATLPDIKNPELKAIAEKLVHYRGALKSYEEKYSGGLDPKKRKDLNDLNATLFSEAGFNRIMKEFARNDLTPAHIKQMTDRFIAAFPQMEALEKEYDALEDEAKKKKEKEKGEDGFKWSRIAGGGLLGLIGYFVGSIFGGPVGTIVSLMLAVGGFFLGGDMGEKLFGGMFGEKGGTSPAAPGVGQQLTTGGPGQTQAVGQNAYQGAGQPFAYQNGMTPEQAAHLAQRGSFVPPQGVYGEGFGGAREHRHHGFLCGLIHPKRHREEMMRDMAESGYPVQDFGRGYAPPPPQYYGAPPLGFRSDVRLNTGGTSVGFGNHGNNPYFNLNTRIR